MSRSDRKAPDVLSRGEAQGPQGVAEARGLLGGPSRGRSSAGPPFVRHEETMACQTHLASLMVASILHFQILSWAIRLFYSTVLPLCVLYAAFEAG